MNTRIPLRIRDSASVAPTTGVVAWNTALGDNAGVKLTSVGRVFLTFLGRDGPPGRPRVSERSEGTWLRLVGVERTPASTTPRAEDLPRRTRSSRREGERIWKAGKQEERQRCEPQMGRRLTQISEGDFAGAMQLEPRMDAHGRESQRAELNTGSWRCPHQRVFLQMPSFPPNLAIERGFDGNRMENMRLAGVQGLDEMPEWPDTNRIAR